mmetsp:Transcript_54894/g.75052  ORF Transcript_54894/g.75052 Transcript_54894/m.75052 type:complete len:99 (+) Transcript_54894:198-494(+)
MRKASVWMRIKLKLRGGTSWQQNKAIRKRNPTWEPFMSSQSILSPHPQTFASSSWKPSKLCQDNLKIFLKFLQVISLVHYYDSKFHLFDQETILCKLI